MRAPWLLYASGLLMFLYVLYAVWGAYAKTFGVPVPIKLGDVGEFLLFFSSVAVFAMHVLSMPERDTREAGGEGKDGTS